MNNKVKFLRGTSNEYAAAEKDNDTIYFTTDDGKLYIGDKEVSGNGSITIDDTLSDTSTNPVQNKVVKQAIDNKADKSKYGDTTINVGRTAGTDVGEYSTAEGYDTTASGDFSHAEGAKTTTSGDFSHAEGLNTIAIGESSHAEGGGTVVIGESSHAEGRNTAASGGFSHAEGLNTMASGNSSHAGGDHATASGNRSFSHGNYTNATHDDEIAFGKFNQSNDDTLFSVGDGTADNARHNAFEITKTGGKLHDKDIATTDLIPTSLPANGGNADTVDGYHVDNLIHSSGSIPPEYITEFLRINNDTKSIERWSTDNLKVAFANNAAKAENADTVDGKHANDFIYPRAHLNNVDLNTILYPCSALAMADCTNIPTTNSWGTILCYSGGTGSHVQLWVSALDSVMYKRHYDGASWSDWKEISTTPIKSTGLITSPTDGYGTIILPNSDTRRYLSIAPVGCYAEMFLFNDKYTVHIVNENYEKIINTPVTYIAFYIE